ncbi:hypothetical protein COLO4_10961 [Corchorus olitorius]|uniref:Uncharacterized protein n=1 Tax=Corchorus olitorius TaxID=93759 RepID=A0A1R3K696_9ROSI|nr:hypothetical protein COLO4_10961 [Corchorus olitorius]
MEAHKERKERDEAAKMVRDEQGSSNKKEDVHAVESTTKTTGFDPITKVVINETIVSDSDNKGTNQHGAQNPDDVLAFSRAVHNIDSSLE